MSERRAPERSRRLLLHDTTDVVSRCRDFTRQALAEWNWPPGVRHGDGPGAGSAEEGSAGDETAEDVLLLVSEVAANACMHAGGVRSLLLRCTVERLRIEVTDASPVTPVAKARPDPGLPGGHGLLIVERLARAWGSEPVDGGKCVWVEVEAPPGP
ncbi:ATP-binding protein [Streptomyces sp. NPDC085524]|uniref:ATP-binding protein n=1 Tax=unclassified Streptomyces TaxID=2593676 RepID=UPI0035DCF16D